MAKFNIRKHKRPRRHLSTSSKRSFHSNSESGYRNYSLYVKRVQKEVVPHKRISSHTMGFLNSLINSIFERIAMEAANVLYFRNRCTLTPEDIQRAVHLVLPGKLAQNAVGFGSEAVNRFIHS
ncbi:PREDICTED: histone H2B subacrosomal variant-like [Elephantulus edwardii]|uniref:histone H2B subacrosomal variant-like n=1 Tax=Elephantulus edwardii TaxID=28737 RepID=UPI0003F0C04C|nr:PREDICTED: histone H2B subacrosomal variant-like [Elephantulus edwardii]